MQKYEKYGKLLHFYIEGVWNFPLVQRIVTANVKNEEGLFWKRKRQRLMMMAFKKWAESNKNKRARNL